MPLHKDFLQSPHANLDPGLRAAIGETKIFTKDYTFMASDIDSKVSSRAIALKQFKRALLEPLGTYLGSETAVNIIITP